MKGKRKPIKLTNDKKNCNEDNSKENNYKTLRVTMIKNDNNKGKS